MGNKVLVTGANGFIGSHLTEELVRSGYEVRAMVHYNSFNFWGWIETLPGEIKTEIEVFAADIRDPYLVRQSVSGCDIVFHLAALIAIPYSYQAPASYIQTNAFGTLNIAQACLDENCSCLIHTSTSETYGTAEYLPIDERHPLVAQSPYTASKIAADKIIESYYRSYDLPAVTLRPFNTFGPRQSARAVIPTIISQIIAGCKKIKLGSLQPIREFNYVKDIARGFLAASRLQKALGKTINLGNGESVSIKKLVEIIQGVCGSNLPIELDAQRVRPLNSEVMRLTCENSLAQKVLGWKPEYTLRRGLKETADWMMSNIDYYKANKYNR